MDEKLSWVYMTCGSLEEAKKIINSSSIPLVVKADGLASGKGVFIPNSKDECFKAAESIFNGRFGSSGNIVVLEEKIVFSKNTKFSKPLAKLEKGRLVIIKECKLNWCRIQTGDYIGWINTKNVWGI